MHRNVHVLLASAGAVERKTQRVRKAAKLGVAVVDATPFLDGEAGAFDADAHALRVADADADGGGGKAVDLNDDACWVGSAKYDGGCSCACHDEPGAPPFCDWCAPSTTDIALSGLAAAKNNPDRSSATRARAPGPRWAHRASCAAFFSSTSLVSRRPQTSSTLSA